MTGDEATDSTPATLARIAARPARFEQILGQSRPDPGRHGCSADRPTRSQHLPANPGSCSETRSPRGRAFAQTSTRCRRARSARPPGRWSTTPTASSDDYVFSRGSKLRSCPGPAAGDSSTRRCTDSFMDAARADLRGRPRRPAPRGRVRGARRRYQAAGPTTAPRSAAAAELAGHGARTSSARSARFRRPDAPARFRRHADCALCQ